MSARSDCPVTRSCRTLAARPHARSPFTRPPKTRGPGWHNSVRIQAASQFRPARERRGQRDANRGCPASSPSSVAARGQAVDVPERPGGRCRVRHAPPLSARTGLGVRHQSGGHLTGPSRGRQLDVRSRASERTDDAAGRSWPRSGTSLAARRRVRPYNSSRCTSSWSGGC